MCGLSALAELLVFVLIRHVAHMRIEDENDQNIDTAPENYYDEKCTVMKFANQIMQH